MEILHFWPAIRTRPLWMKCIIGIAAAATLLLTGCDSGTVAPELKPSEMVSIHTTAPRPAPLPPPQMLLDEAPPPKPKLMPFQVATPIIFSPEDEKVRAALPFTPAIAMDPIDGSKISIRAATPIFEYKGKIFYFSTEANKQQFASNPEAILKGGLMRL